MSYAVKSNETNHVTACLHGQQTSFYLCYVPTWYVVNVRDVRMERRNVGR